MSTVDGYPSLINTHTILLTIVHTLTSQFVVRFDLIHLIIVPTYGRTNSLTTTYKLIHQLIQSSRVLIRFYFDIVFQHTMIHSKEQIQNTFMKSMKNRAIDQFTNNTHTHSNTNNPTPCIIIYCYYRYLYLCINTSFHYNYY